MAKAARSHIMRDERARYDLDAWEDRQWQLAAI